MNIIKLNAIDSTNLYLKKLVRKSTVKSYTVVVAEHQTLGRGQLGATWISESGKNLTFSILINFENFKIKNSFYLSMAVSLGVLNIVKKNVKTPVAVKWPNDIMAEKDKLAGILIENTLKGDCVKQSIIGIGLNVHQKVFPKSITNATSLINLTETNFDKEALLKNIVAAIKYYVGFIDNNEFKKLKDIYLQSLYKFNELSMFEDTMGTIFLGKIVDIFEDGRLVIALENKTIRKFSLKEIKFVNR
ncbi:biotin--[acetyl-CoA-carboxylase] ligase [Lutibacter sp.]